MLKILIACEESQIETEVFRYYGAEAYSCDIQETSGTHPEWHLKGDCRDYINNKFYEWDLIIGHPPCTYLAASGACNLYDNKHRIKNYNRYYEGWKARELFMDILNADCKHIAVENPRPLKCYELPKQSQVLSPEQFGSKYSKRTYYWLKGLPILDPRYYYQKAEYSWVGTHYGSKLRSKGFAEIADAMAQTWIPYIERKKNK